MHFNLCKPVLRRELKNIGFKALKNCGWQIHPNTCHSRHFLKTKYSGSKNTSVDVLGVSEKVDSVMLKT